MSFSEQVIWTWNECSQFGVQCTDIQGSFGTIKLGWAKWSLDQQGYVNKILQFGCAEVSLEAIPCLSLEAVFQSRVAFAAKRKLLLRIGLIRRWSAFLMTHANGPTSRTSQIRRRSRLICTLLVTKCDVLRAKTIMVVKSDRGVTIEHIVLSKESLLYCWEVCPAGSFFSRKEANKIYDSKSMISMIQKPSFSNLLLADNLLFDPVPMICRSVSRSCPLRPPQNPCNYTSQSRHSVTLSFYLF